MSDSLPKYGDLPVHRGERVSWGLFADENLGTMNLLTPDRVVAAARLIQRGTVFPLDRGPFGVGPGMFRRTPPRHRVFEAGGGRALDDVLEDYYPQGSSQWDSLAHILAFRDPDTFYGAATRDDIAEGRRTIDHLADHGVVGRLVVADVETVMRRRDPAYDPSVSTAISADVIAEALDSTGLTFEAGDVLLLHTGWTPPQAAADQSGSVVNVEAVGVEQSQRTAEYLWNLHPSAVVTDCPALESWPPGDEATSFGFLHATILGRLGIHVGELWKTAALVEDCRADGRYEAFVSSAPARIPGGVGSPANAVAIK